MNFSSKLLENAVNEMSKLPGIGKRTALRLVLFLLNQPNSQTIHLSKSLIELVDGVVLCKNCHNISDLEICEICSNIKRDKSIICVVEDIRDVMAIENIHNLKIYFLIYCLQFKYLTNIKFYLFSNFINLISLGKIKC